MGSKSETSVEGSRRWAALPVFLLRRAAALCLTHWRTAAACVAALALGVVLLCSPSGCGPKGGSSPVRIAGDRTVRVRVMQSASEANIRAGEPPVYFTSSDPRRRVLDLPRDAKVPVTFADGVWRAGRSQLGRGELFIEPVVEGSVAINDTAYRGRYRLVPVGDSTFDVVNDVDLDHYLAGVIAAELLAGWHEEAYRAQAIAARTYVLYEKHFPRSPRHWDVHADTRSQVYGGIAAESAKSRSAAAATAGVVLGHGPRGDERIFKAYFSSCCGGITQSSSHAFGESYIEPLSEQNVGALCSASPRFTWGPVVLTKEQLTQRMRLWGARRGRPERNMATVRSVEIVGANRHGRPVQFRVTDANGARHLLIGEELRWAVNAGAQDGVILYSSFIDNIINDSDRIRFVGGHGHGHGVGMCQWCAEARARAGMRHEDIVIAAYPGARLVRAY